MSKDSRLRKSYSKLTWFERFILSAQALQRGDDDEFYRLRWTCAKAAYVGPEPTFKNFWDGAMRAVSLAYSWWWQHETAFLAIAQSLQFVEIMNVQARDLASEYYCKGYEAARRDAGRSEDELKDTNDCINDCDACTDRCDDPPEKGIYTFSDLEIHDAFVYKPAIDDLASQLKLYAASMQGLYIALERLCYVHDITLRDLLAVNPAFQDSIKRSREVLMVEIDEEIYERVTKKAEMYFAALEAVWNHNTHYEFRATIEAVYGPEVAHAYEELTESLDLSDWDEVKLFHPESVGL